jgi:hypothetical protein
VKRIKKRPSNVVINQDVLEEGVVRSYAKKFVGKRGGGHFAPLFCNQGLTDYGCLHTFCPRTG